MFGPQPENELFSILHRAACGEYPPGDFTTTHVPSPQSPADAVLAFFGHHLLASSVDGKFVRAWTDADPFALSDVRFLSALASKLSTTPGIYDAVFAARGIGATPKQFGLVELNDCDHPRAQRALAYRDPETLRVFADVTGAGVLVMGRGLAGRLEAAYEVAPEARGKGIGRELIRAARMIAPRGEPVFLQISPGNVWSMQALASDVTSWRCVGSEVLFLRHPKGKRVD